MFLHMFAARKFRYTSDTSFGILCTKFLEIVVATSGLGGQSQ